MPPRHFADGSRQLLSTLDLQYTLTTTSSAFLAHDARAGRLGQDAIFTLRAEAEAVA